MSTIAKTLLTDSSAPQAASRKASAGATDGGSGWDGLKRMIQPLASLRLTVVLLVASMVIVFAGTWAQIDQGIWQVQKKYFHSFFTWIDFQLFLPRPDLAAGQKAIRGGFPFLGGYTIVLLMLVNLLAAHGLRFRMTLKHVLIIVPQVLIMIGLLVMWSYNATSTTFLLGVGGAVVVGVLLLASLFHYFPKRTGVILIHSGLIVLIAGELITSLMAVESQMQLDEGASASYTTDIRSAELAVIDHSAADHDNVVVIPASKLARQETVRHEKLPFAVRVEKYFKNSDFVEPAPGDAGPFIKARDMGQLKNFAVKEIPINSGAGDMKADLPTAFVSVLAGDKTFGPFAVALASVAPTRVNVDGKDYVLDLRFKRLYKPYTITLQEFNHDKYTGTEVAKNFASNILLTDPSRNEKREVKIWMNHPLRYAGETFYQSSYLEPEKNGGRKGTVLQVVHNPAIALPYAACIIGALGMVIHFGMHLLDFLRRTLSSNRPAVAQAVPPAPQESDRRPNAKGARPVVPELPYESPLPLWRRPAVMAPAAVVAVALIYVLSLGRIPKNPGQFNLNAWAALPMVDGGRVMPIDSVAKNSLRILSGKDTLSLYNAKGDYEKSMPAVQWLAEHMAGKEESWNYRILRIDNQDVVDLLGLKEGQKRYSLNEIKPQFMKLQEQAKQAQEASKNKKETLYQKKLLELWHQIGLAINLSPDGWGGLFVAPPTKAGEDWTTLRDVAGAAQAGGAVNPGARYFMAAVDAYGRGSASEFNDAVGSYHGWLDENLAARMRKVRAEVMFNRFDPFVTSMALYVGVFVLAVGGWLTAGTAATRPLLRSAYWLLLGTFSFHSLGLIARIYISGRPPVTNLYSSAVFIPWGVALLCIGLEWIYRNGVGSAVASVIAVPSLLIAHYLSGDGDTMKMLQAVLDTNIWLATHVIVITLGYASAFLAGFLAVAYVIGGLLTDALDAGVRKTIARMTYGIVCFAMLFSFVGTILGGIWADQSWGRFWGWDPKENGALLIVLWCAIILHSRWAGLARERGVMLLAIFGNVVTAWSWFGTNMLGVGLHSYGFMDSALFWLVAFMASQLFVIALGLIPQDYWRSFRAEAGAAAA